MRGLFPDSFYKDVVMKNLDGMSIKVLSPKDNESKRLVDWIEGGVYDAVKRGYLKSLLFGISTNAEGTELLEEYVYNFTYGADGALKMDIALNGGKGGSKNPALLKGNKVTVNNVRYQVTRLMRMLVQLCKTLEKVPSERYLFCRLVYHDNTPDDYEPQYFRSMDSSSELGHFAKKPFTMNVGAISTEHHQVGLRLKSILDACDVEEGEADAVEEEASVEGPSETEDEGQDNCQEDESCEKAAQNNHLEASDARRGRNNSTPLRMKAKADLEDLVMTEPQDQDMIQSQQQGDGSKAAVKLESENTKRLRAAGADIVPARVHLQAGDQNHYSRLSAVAVRSGAVSPEPADHQQGVEAGGVVQQLQGGDVSALKPTKALISDPALQPAALLEADIRDWCLSRSQVDVEDVMSNFIQVSAATATKMLSMFHKEGLLQATSRKYSFKVVKKEGTVRDSALASHMGSLLVGPRAQNPLNKSGGAGGMKGAATDQGMEHHEGSDITMAPSDANNEGGDNGMSVDEVRSKRAAAAVHNSADHVTTGGQHMPTLDQQDAPANNVFYDASQQSGRLRPSKVRKVSYVAEPIHQTKKNTKGAAVSTAAAAPTPPGSSRSRLGRMRR
ncbi:hypothetical protein CEUSTIGMA_g10041.t1 [Chlamydomonas eustigma]|uniref:HORMA domain-containing protein n=1 Tax=Chlamydomonas eustigma TaxID=1157962 RepID=A0A250XHQ2_9CHLO|nr:hypothetical protein CEUSTIGMA_g10041.t1 [Chlamydomonas eustigma]|eukprot:GAX82615.1 hypothetical protein CEUSTIGMA_g10041.t1 [Chlamydomonas eustigma]